MPAPNQYVLLCQNYEALILKTERDREFLARYEEHARRIAEVLGIAPALIGDISNGGHSERHKRERTA